MRGGPEDLIKKLKSCGYCIFEDILTEEQRKIKVLKVKIPERHPHRSTIEQICGEDYDGVCPMKYAAMRSLYDDSMAAQLGAAKNFIGYLSKKRHRKVNFNEALLIWAKDRDLGQGIKESYAKRYRNVWEKGIRKNKQILTAPQIYEIVIARPRTYEKAIEVLDLLIKEYKKRDAVK